MKGARAGAFLAVWGLDRGLESRAPFLSAGVLPWITGAFLAGLGSLAPPLLSWAGLGKTIVRTAATMRGRAKLGWPWLAIALPRLDICGVFCALGAVL